MALVGQVIRQRSHRLHLSLSKITSISGRLIYRASVGHTAVQAPQWVQISSSLKIWCSGVEIRTPWSFKKLTPLLKPDRDTEEISNTIWPSRWAEIWALRILNSRSYFLTSWHTRAFWATSGGKSKMTIFEYNDHPPFDFKILKCLCNTGILSKVYNIPDNINIP